MTDDERRGTLDDLITKWERQQDAYVRHRAQRFEIVVDAIAHAGRDPDVVLDIAGGLGSFSKVVLERFPDVHVITLDHDPSLLELARHNLAAHRSRSSIVEANLVDPTWTRQLDGIVPDVVISSTALHWLSNAEVVALYRQIAGLLASGGVFFNADHLSHHVPDSFFQLVSRADEAAQERSGFTPGVPDWNGWWELLRQTDGFAELVAERDRRFSGGGDNPSTPALHIGALTVAGFVEAGTIWQYFDDFVVYGVR